MLILILAVLVVIAVPVFINMAVKAQFKTNLINIRNVRSTVITSIQTGLVETDSTTPEARNINEGLADGAGWVAVAQIDEENEVTDIKIFVVDEISDYKDGIAPGKAKQPVPIGSDAKFYEVPRLDLISYPFASVKPTSGGNKVYTVQVAVNEVEVDLVR